MAGAAVAAGVSSAAAADHASRSAASLTSVATKASSEKLPRGLRTRLLRRSAPVASDDERNGFDAACALASASAAAAAAGSFGSAGSVSSAVAVADAAAEVAATFDSSGTAAAGGEERVCAAAAGELDAAAATATDAGAASVAAPDEEGLALSLRCLPFGEPCAALCTRCSACEAPRTRCASPVGRSRGAIEADGARVVTVTLARFTDEGDEGEGAGAAFPAEAEAEAGLFARLADEDDRATSVFGSYDAESSTSSPCCYKNKMRNGRNKQSGTLSSSDTFISSSAPGATNFLYMSVANLQ